MCCAQSTTLGQHVHVCCTNSSRMGCEISDGPAAGVRQQLGWVVGRSGLGLLGFFHLRQSVVVLLLRASSSTYGHSNLHRMDYVSRMTEDCTQVLQHQQQWMFTLCRLPCAERSEMDRNSLDPRQAIQTSVAHPQDVWVGARPAAAWCHSICM